MIPLLISILLAYFIGSIPTSYIIGKTIKKIDIREHGSGNVGATNALRVFGVKIGIITLLLDISKGFFTVFFAKNYFHTTNSENASLFVLFVSFAVILGHIFTIYLKFKGGKGVATSAGVFLALTTVPVLICLAVFILVVWLTRYVSLGSILAAITLFVVELIFNIINDFANLYNLIFVSIIALFIIVKHHSNIKRLLQGNENKLSFKKNG